MANREERGTLNPSQSAYADTVADYSNDATIIGDNTIEDVSCDSSVYVGSIVRMNGATAVNALADSFTNSKVIGICINKPTSTTCDILTCGFTGNVFAGLSTSATYFLSDSILGGITSTPPTNSGSYVIRIGRTQNGQNIIFQLERVAKRS